jgi:effector-binding domain-containing protein
MSTHVVRLEQVQPVPLAVVRRQARPSDLSRLVPECCGLVWNVVRAQRTPAGRHVALYWDDTIRLEVGVELKGAFVDDGDVVRSAIPAGTAATTTHFGPYSGLGAAHDAVLEWCKSNGRQLAGPSWEIYGHWLPEWNEDSSRIRTDVYYLLG